MWVGYAAAKRLRRAALACDHHVIHKTGSAQRVHNATPPEKDRATATCNMHKILVEIGPLVVEICSRADRQTDRRGHHSTPLRYRGRGIKVCESSGSQVRLSASSTVAHHYM